MAAIRAGRPAGLAGAAGVFIANSDCHERCVLSILNHEVIMNKIRTYSLWMAIFLLEISLPVSYAGNLPVGFVYLQDIDSTIVQDIRYATAHNFIGSPISGYEAGACILTLQAAQALAQVQKELLQSKLSLKVFDCYRPQRAVDEFIHWNQDPADQKMKAEFYPRVDKAKFFDLGYVAKQSGHSRGSTMDLTIVPLGAHPQNYENGQALVSCLAPYHDRFNDAGIDMGTGFDCMDKLAHNDNHSISPIAYKHRMLLKSLMEKHGFSAYQPEWWHFTLKNEPYPQTYFDFPILSH